jgi:hypothetical protein
MDNGLNELPKHKALNVSTEYRSIHPTSDDIPLKLMGKERRPLYDNGKGAALLSGKILGHNELSWREIK